MNPLESPLIFGKVTKYLKKYMPSLRAIGRTCLMFARFLNSSLAICKEYSTDIDALKHIWKCWPRAAIRKHPSDGKLRIVCSEIQIATLAKCGQVLILKELLRDCAVVTMGPFARSLLFSALKNEGLRKLICRGTNIPFEQSDIDYCLGRLNLQFYANFRLSDINSMEFIIGKLRGGHPVKITSQLVTQMDPERTQIAAIKGRNMDNINAIIRRFECVRTSQPPFAAMLASCKYYCKPYCEYLLYHYGPILLVNDDVLNLVCRRDMDWVVKLCPVDLLNLSRCGEYGRASTIILARAFKYNASKIIHTILMRGVHLANFALNCRNVINNSYLENRRQIATKLQKKKGTSHMQIDCKYVISFR
jgi:hypothetical protein